MFKIGDRVILRPIQSSFAWVTSRALWGTIQLVLPDGTLIVDIDDSGPRVCTKETFEIELCEVKGELA